MDIYKKKSIMFYEDELTNLHLIDIFEGLKNLKTKSIDMIFADPPYFLSGDGITCHSGKMVSVKKADWDEQVSLREKHQFNKKWIKMCKRVLSDDGTIWISGTFHNIYSIGMALEENGFKIINNITWKKTNPPPNISCRAFTHSTETIIWAKKDIKRSKYVFNYQLMKEMNLNKQMKDVWETSLTKPSEKKEGKHPTQKPEDLLKIIIKSSTNKQSLILDPFTGSGTTNKVAKELERFSIGFDNNIEYLNIAKRRLIKLDGEGLFDNVNSNNN